MSPQKHLLVGICGGTAVGLISGNSYLGAGFFLGSWVIDLDHLWQYWRINNFDKPFNVKEFFRFNDKHGRKFGENPYLHLLCGHTIEINLLLLFLAMLLGNPTSLLFWGMLFGSVIHLVLDDINMYRGYVKRGKFPWFMLKRCHSIVEFYIRKLIFKEKEYSQILKEQNNNKKNVKRACCGRSDCREKNKKIDSTVSAWANQCPYCIEERIKKLSEKRI